MGMRWVWKDVDGKRVAEQEFFPARREAKPAKKADKPKADKPAEPKAE